MSAGASGRGGDSPGVVAAFFVRFIDDVDHGRSRTLEEYQREFPGHEELIARELSRLSASEAAGDEKLSLGASGVPDANAARGAEVVDGYTLIEVLGEGGMGTVWRARQHLPLEREVALKVIRPGMDSNEVVARFEGERQTIARLRHDGIARVFDAGVTRDGRPFFAMELVAGEPITGYADRRRLGIGARLRLFGRVCDAVQHAHQNAVIHRDLKPSNILVCEQGAKAVAKVIDFGIAKSMAESPRDEAGVTSAGQIIGTPAYMSPEQAVVGGLAVDTRSDVYSLGVVLHELLTGELPHLKTGERSVSWTEQLRRLQDDDPVRPSTRVRRLDEVASEVASQRDATVGTLSRHLRGDLDWIVLRALERDVDRRYDSAAELGADIENHLRHRPVLAGPPTIRYRLRKFARRHRVMISTLSTIVVLSTFAAIAAWQGSKRSDANRRDAEARRLHDSGVEERDLFARRRRDAVDARRRWQVERSLTRPWAPAWSLEKEIAAWQEWRRISRELPGIFNRAVLSFSRAREASATALPEVQAALSEMFRERYERVLWDDAQPLSPEYFAGPLRAIDTEGRYSALLDGSGAVAVLSDPPDAAVRCYRYDLVEGRAMPRAYDPRVGKVVGEPYLEVERVWTEAAAGVFARGDRIVSLDGRQIRLLGDLVSVVNDRKGAAAVKLELRRRGKSETVEWTPLSNGSGRVETYDDLRGKLGVSFAGFPIDIAAAPVVGKTAARRPVDVRLPRGSYLLVLSKPGYLDTRLPVAFPRHPDAPGEPVRVRLWKAGETPEGFVQVAAGGFVHGAYAADGQVFDPLASGWTHVDGFFMKRTEVTVREYLEFLNDEATGGRLAGESRAAAATIDLDELRRRSMLPDVERSNNQYTRRGETLLVPRSGFRDEGGKGRYYFVREDGVWRYGVGKSGSSLDEPVSGLPTTAALEYVKWLNEERAHDGWRFRLARDLEWEKAARGVDRRVHVWGDYLLWSFCSSGPGTRESSHLGVVASHPFDESVWGVRDLAGSLPEPVLELRDRTARFIVLRGGGWSLTDRYEFCIANRNGVRIDYPRSDGIRIVAEPLR